MHPVRSGLVAGSDEFVVAESLLELRVIGVEIDELVGEMRVGLLRFRIGPGDAICRTPAVENPSTRHLVSTATPSAARSTTSGYIIWEHLFRE